MLANLIYFSYLTVQMCPLNIKTVCPDQDVQGLYPNLPCTHVSISSFTYLTFDSPVVARGSKGFCDREWQSSQRLKTFAIIASLGNKISPTHAPSPQASHYLDKCVNYDGLYIMY